MTVPAADTKVLVFAKAPVAGAVKTRLIPLLGPERAAAVQRVLIERALATALDARVGEVELWCAPSAQHPLLERYCRQFGIAAASQCGGDLGARMQHAAASALASAARVIIIGVDCAALTAADLHAAARALDEQHEAVLMPAEDGGYVLIALRRWDARLFEDIEWGSSGVMAATRARLTALGWRWRELATSWDVDRPADFERLAASGLMPELDAALRSARNPRQ